MGSKKDVLDITTTGLLAGVGSSVISSVGGNPAGLTRVSSGLSSVGSLTGAKMVLKETKKLKF